MLYYYKIITVMPLLVNRYFNTSLRYKIIIIKKKKLANGVVALNYLMMDIYFTYQGYSESGGLSICGDLTGSGSAVPYRSHATALFTTPSDLMATALAPTARSVGLEPITRPCDTAIRVSEEIYITLNTIRFNMT